jgi:hypothetical protein
MEANQANQRIQDEMSKINRELTKGEELDDN